MEQQELNENLYQMSLSILGSKHWCTNLTLLLLLEQTLLSFHSTLLLQSSSQTKNEEKEEGLDMTELAQAIDTLQRLWTYTSSLNLKASNGHLLLDVTIGVARTLVSLGDVKSQKYGAEWVGRVEEHVLLFCNEDDGMMKKVVDAIKNSWKRTDGEEGKEVEEDGKKPRKRLKTG